jgi:hypothetical protein
MLKIITSELGIVRHTYTPNIWEAQSEGTRIRAQCGVPRNTRSPKESFSEIPNDGKEGSPQKSKSISILTTY